jgi:polyhydroxyalkanoate synthesis regulator phasin
MAFRARRLHELGRARNGQHLNGSIYGSTLRRTLCACLLKPLSLELVAAGKLTRDSEKALSAWMRRHLEVAVHPFPNRDALGDLEKRVLAVLDPQLNLDEMPPSRLRERVSELRRRLTHASAMHKESRAAAASTASLVLKPAKRAPTLHEEIEAILRQEGRAMTTAEIAEAVNQRGRYSKRDGTPVTPFQIHGRTRNYP